MFRNVTLAIIVALLLPLAAQAQDKTTIKIKKEIKGTKTHEIKKSTDVQIIKVSDNDKNVLEDKTTTTILTDVFDETILERPDPKKKPTALKRSYEKAIAKSDADTQELPYQGKTILIELKDGKYRFRYEGGAEIEGEDAKYLDKEFNKDSGEDDTDLSSLMLPKNAVAPGESWKIDMAELTKIFTKEGKMDIDLGKSTGTGKLLKTYQKDGKLFGDLSYKLAIAVKSINTMGMEIPLQPGAVIAMNVSISGCIDGSDVSHKAKFDFDFNAKATISANDMNILLEVTARQNSENDTVELKAK